MASLNSVMIIGKLGKDPELRYLQSGAGVCNMTVATDEGWITREGEKKSQTEWHRVTAFERTAENCANYLRKGSTVYVEGKLQTRKWQDKNGQDRYQTEIHAKRVIFLDKPKGQQELQQQQEPETEGPYRQNDSVPF